MASFEIERKYLVDLEKIPFSLDNFQMRIIEQGYLCTKPVVRIRKDNDIYELTYKSGGLMKRREENLPLTKDAYEHLKEKVDGRLIKKRRYMIPLENNLIAELDIFDETLSPLVLIEVEFPDEATAAEFIAPAWFGEDVTFCGKYHNSYLSRNDLLYNA